MSDCSFLYTEVVYLQSVWLLRGWCNVHNDKTIIDTSEKEEKNLSSNLSQLKVFHQPVACFASAFLGFEVDIKSLGYICCVHLLASLSAVTSSMPDI